MIKKFDTYNESVRDKMTPKSDEDIENALNQLSPIEKLEKGVINDMAVLVKRALEEGADIHYRDDWALEVASTFCSEEMVKLLIDNGANAESVKTKLKGSWSNRNEMNIRYKRGVNVIQKYETKNSVFTRFKKFIKNESVRDKMSPKSEEEVRRRKDEILKDIVDTVKLYKGGLSLYDYSEYPTTYPITIGYDKFEDKGKKIELVHRIITLFDDSVKIAAFGIHNGKTISEYSLSYDDLEPDILLKVRRMLNNIKKSVHESVRDKMTPKSEDEINKSIIKTMNDNDNSGTIYPEASDYDDFKHIADLFGEPMENLFVITELDSKWEIINGYLSKLVREDDNYILFDEMDGKPIGGEWFCYPERKIAFFKNRPGQHTLNMWTYSKPFTQTLNESVRDKMTPKSKEDIEKTLEGLPDGKKISLNRELKFYTKEEIDNIIKGMSVRDKFIQGNRYGLNTLVYEALEYRKPFDEVKVGDWLTKKDKYMMYQIKEKVSFDGPQEYYDYMRDHSWLHKFDGSSTEKFVEKTLLRGKVSHVDCVVVSMGNRYLIMYDDNVGVFPYTEKEEKDKCDLSDNREKIEQMKTNESVRDKMTPRSKDETKDLLEDIMRILSYTLYRWPTAKWSREEAHDYVKSHKSFVEQWVADFGYTPERLEILAGEMLKFFGTKINESVRDKMTPKSDDDIKNAMKNMPTDNLFTAFCRSVRNNDDIDTWIEMGVDIDITGSNGDTVLHVLCWMDGVDDIVKKVIDKGADPNVINKEGYTPLMIAAYAGTISNVKVILNSDKFKSYVYNQIQRSIDLTKKDEKIRKILIDYELKQPLTESVRDKMTPKSRDEIRLEIDRLTEDEKKELMDKFIYRQDFDGILSLLNNGMEITRHMTNYARKHRCLSVLSLLRHTKEWRKERAIIAKMEKERTNEGVRDKMTPMSDDDIRNKLNGLDSDKKLQIMYNGPHDELLFDYFTDDEVMKMIRDLEEDRKGIFLRAALGYRDYKFAKMLLDAGADPNLDDCWPMRYMVNWKEKALIDLLKSYGGVLEPEDIVMKESLRDKMSPVSDDFINDKINNSTQEELIDIMYRSISSNDVDSVKLVLPHISLKDGGKELYDLCEFSVEVGHYKILDILIEKITDKGIIKRVIDYMEDYIDDAYLTELAKGRIRPLIEKYKKLINESFGDGENMTFVNDSNIKRYNENGLKSFQMSFSDFVNSRIDEGVRDKMTPKTTDVIKSKLKDIPIDRALEKLRDQGLKVLDYFSTDEIKEYMWDKSKDEVLLLSSELGIIEFVQDMLEHGVDVNTKDTNGWTALMWASSFEHMDILTMLIEWGADVNIGDVNGDTALMDAAEWGLIDVVEFLIKNGADVNQKTSEGYTALMSACMKGRTDVAEVLLRNGADINAKDKWNFTALSLATDEGHDETVSLLKKHGAKE